MTLALIAVVVAAVTFGFVMGWSIRSDIADQRYNALLASMQSNLAAVQREHAKAMERSRRALEESRRIVGDERG